MEVKLVSYYLRNVIAIPAEIINFQLQFDFVAINIICIHISNITSWLETNFKSILGKFQLCITIRFKCFLFEKSIHLFSNISSFGFKILFLIGTAKLILEINETLLDVYNV